MLKSPHIRAREAPPSPGKRIVRVTGRAPWRAACLLLGCLALLACARSPMVLEPGGDRWDPATQPFPLWLHRIPPTFPVMLALGTGVGIPGRQDGLRQARQQATEHLRLQLAARVRVDQRLVRRPPELYLVEASRVEPLGPEIPIEEVQCLLHFVDTRRNLTWCLAARVPPSRLSALRTLLAPYTMLAPLSHASPVWLEAPHAERAQAAGHVGTGSAQRSLRPSEQLRLALDRALFALARQQELSAEVRWSILRSGSRSLALQQGHLHGEVILREVQIRAVWRTRRFDGLYLQVETRAGPAGR